MIRLSHTSLSRYFPDQGGCPARWAYHYVHRLPVAPSPAMERGTRLHTAAEKYFTGQLEQLPVEFFNIQESMKMIRASSPQVELELHFDEDWKLCRPKDAAWLLILDILYRSEGDLNVVDLKSGRVSDGHNAQLMLYATGAMSAFPCETAHVAGLYIDQGRFDSATDYKREEQLKPLQSYFNERRQIILKDKTFRTEPSHQACKWCPFRASNGGPCKDSVV